MNQSNTDSESSRLFKPAAYTGYRLDRTELGVSKH